MYRLYRRFYCDTRIQMHIYMPGSFEACDNVFGGNDTLVAGSTGEHTSTLRRNAGKKATADECFDKPEKQRILNL